MHYFQQRYLLEHRQFPNLSGLYVVDLPNKGLLSGLEIRVVGTNPDNSGYPDVWLHDRIKKWEVMVNGSQVVKSLTGDQLLGLMHYQKCPVDGHDSKNLPAGMCEEKFMINFGRHYHDLEYMIDLSQVNDPELRLEYDFEMTSQNGWTHGKAMTAKPYLYVVPHLLRDPNVVPLGYIKTAEIAREISAASKQFNLTIPRGPTYSNLYLQSLYASEGLGLNIDHLEVNINSDDIVPYRMQIEEIEAELVRMYGLAEVQQWTILTGGQAYPFPIETGHVAGLIGNAELAEFAFSNIWANLGIPYFVSGAAGTAETGNHGVHMLIRGAFPFSLAAIPILDPWDKNTWINTAELGDFWVRVEETASGGTHVYIKLLGDEVVTKYTTPSWP